MRRVVSHRLRPPLLAAACLHRPALLARIDTASRGKLLVLSAPMGYGKTTLLTQWVRHTVPHLHVAWLTLDESDAGPARFFAALIDALRSAVPGFDAGGAGASVCEGLARLQQELVIVLDDIHHLAGPAMVPVLDVLLQRSPDHVHWVLCGRRVPDLNLSSFRLNDQLATLHAADLGFDSALILQLSRKLCTRPVSRQQADAIQACTEGWVAGVKLALLALGDDGAQAFAGSHRDVAGYLGALLQQQDEPLREFLIGSSVVDRMNAELCNALLGLTHSQALLEHLERSQLFVQPLDRHGQCYRYHPLFLDFLRSVLRRDAARLQGLHERASRWFAAHQQPEPALRHAFAAGPGDWRLQLVATCARTWLYSGDIAAVLGWCEQLPQAEVMAHDGLCECYIVSLILSRRFDAAQAALRGVATWADDPQRAVRLGLLHRMWAVLSERSPSDPSGDASGDSAADAVPRFEGSDGFLVGTLWTLQAYGMLRRNRFDMAWRLAMRAHDAFANVSAYGAGYASVVASLAERAQGDLKSAAQRCEQLYASVQGGRRNPAWVNAASALAHMRYEENRLAEAEALCTELLPLLPVASTMENCVIAYFTLARLKAVQAAPVEAFRLLDYLHSVLESGSPGRFLAQVCGEKIRLCLAQGDLLRAQAIAAEFGVPALQWHPARPYDEAWERFGLAQAWMLMHQRQFDAARALLAVLRDSAHAVGYVFREVPLQAALAHAHWQAGDQAAAFDALNRALALTRGHGFTRGVFDETPALPQILAAAVQRRALLHGLPSRYWAKFEDLLGRRPGAASPPKGPAALPLEPLTEREIDMLRLVAQGLSNQQISAQSQIALSTAKWHLKNVFAKLNVSTRTGAIARARDLRLIER